ncbi:MAG: pantoate--beta-alanine ligase [Chitinophagales bacterium]|nr:pantoate--beta-alanine ligase [Chitinophagales bacterium]
MVIFKKAEDINAYLLNIRQKGASLGFIPTMGALHKGHISLVEQAHKNGDITVVSIFVNPTQFNDKNDFDNYPSAITEDKMLLEAAGCDIVFIPSVAEVYPESYAKTPVYDFGYLDTILEGAHRPGHFKGVGQVVARLLEIVKPDNLYLGQKDFQQCMVIKDLAKQIPQLHNMHVKICPTLREPDGLAMSSRNRRLTEPERAVANLLYQCLVSIQTKAGLQPFSVVRKECIEILADKGLKPEYVALADASNLALLDEYDTERQMVALIAAFVGDVRLIDNMLLN